MQFSTVNPLEFLRETAFIARYGTLESERARFLQLFKAVIDSGDLERIRILLPAIASVNWLSHELVNKILLSKADEVINFLYRSPSLSTKELIFVIEELRDEQKIIAITKRYKLSEQVIDKIIKTKNSNIIMGLIKNHHLSLKLMDYQEILRYCANDAKVINALFSRNEYAEYEILEVLAYLKHELSSSELNIIYNALHMGQKYVVCNLQQHNKECINDFPSKSICNKIDELLNAKRLYFAFLIKLLCNGDIDAFLYGISKLADISYHYLLSIVRDRLYTEEFINVYQASGMNEDLLTAVQMVLAIATQLVKQHPIEKSELTRSILVQLKAQEAALKVPELKFLMKLMEESTPL